MKAIMLTFCALCIGNVIIASQSNPYVQHFYKTIQLENLPRLRYGLLTLQNFLNEPIEYELTTSINAEDPDREIRIINGNKKAKGSGIISAQTEQAIRTYPTFVLDKATNTKLQIFGGIVLLKLKRHAGEYTPEQCINEPGTYAINFDKSGNLTVQQQIVVTDAKQNQ